MKTFSEEYLNRAEQEILYDLQDEKLQKIIGSFGGKPTKKDRILNVIFIVLVAGLFVVEIFWRKVVGTVALDLAVFLISVKLIYLMHTQARVNHYQFWILTAIEMKTTIMLEQLQKLASQTETNQRSQNAQN